MNNPGRIAAVVAVAAVAFGAAFLLTGGDDSADDGGSTDVAAGSPGSTTAASGEDEEETSSSPCAAPGAVSVEEAGYDVTFATEPSPPSPQGSTVNVTVLRDGAPVDGATVCMKAKMSGMSHPGINAQADGVGDGRYELGVDFGMRGGWEGSLVVIETGQDPGTMPVTFSVQ